MKSSDIRKAFIDFFSSKGHQVVPSSSLIPGKDPSLLFTNAGMVQFKDIFLGVEAPNFPRAVSSQRCIRAGGKHNDLENVGYTARHHTFFEMLGNFSFGDYFKREAIFYAWEFLTSVLKLPTERLWITVYENDDEAASIWLNEVGVSSLRFSRCGEKDNFWSMGDTGPCGPCTEIFYDHGPKIAGGPPGSSEEDGDRYTEIWNLVFMQFNRDKEGVLHPLPAPSVDTGMGLERIAAVVQGVHDNYEIDIFTALIDAAIKLLPGEIKTVNASLKVIADHIRASAFLIVDGVFPGNEGRSYVLRRIIRRAIRHGNKLHLISPFFYKLVKPLIAVMGDTYPELLQHQAQIEKILIQEENQFARTIEQGMRLLQEQIKQLTTLEIPGEIVFSLYDTYGFPVDLTADIAREEGLTIDIAGFNDLMRQQRELSQATSQFSYYENPQFSETSVFHGYEESSLSAQVLSIVKEGKKLTTLNAGDQAAVILNKTPFYGESGGQVGDRGILVKGETQFQVKDTQCVGEAIVHYGQLIRGQLCVNDSVNAEIDTSRRQAVRLNHTATHLLHAALRSILGVEVQQKGSLVDAERARFDFSHSEALTLDQLNRIETWVNDKIRCNEQVLTELMTIEDAKKSGAIALFDEKYNDSVRVLSMGDFSKELCGGTHALRTGDIGVFKITAEYGVASGIRRIEFVTGSHALDWINGLLSNLDKIAAKLKTTSENASEKLTQFLHETKQQDKEILHLQAKLASLSCRNLLSEIEETNGIKLLIKQLEGGTNQTLRSTLDQLKASLNNAVIVLFTLEKDKMNVVAGISKNILGKVPAPVLLVKHLCGKGGGREDMAQGGGPIPKDLKEKIFQMKTMIVEHAV